MRISVVMAVHNGASELRATLDSILAQTLRDFEVIVVDDGSTDETPSILASYKGLRVITQQNTGLTHALVRGCGEAHGDVIARHDNGDRSHPERFAKQLAKLDEGHVLVACATRFVEPHGDTLYVSRAEGADVTRSLTRDDAARIHALPAHGSAMFRRDVYLAAGGYRPAFRFAQDLDLWIRLARRGSIAILDDVLYEATFAPKSISASNRAAQVRLTEIAVALRDGGDEAALLDEAARVAPAPASKGGEAAALYFIGKCLLRQRNPRGRAYLREALARDPLHWRAWVSMLINR